MNLNNGADAAYDREDQGWFNALPTADLETLWAQVSGPNFVSPAGPWDDEVFDALAARGWFEENGIYAPGGPKDIWTGRTLPSPRARTPKPKASYAYETGPDGHRDCDHGYDYCQYTPNNAFVPTERN